MFRTVIARGFWVVFTTGGTPVVPVAGETPATPIKGDMPGGPVSPPRWRRSQSGRDKRGLSRSGAARVRALPSGRSPYTESLEFLHGEATLLCAVRHISQYMKYRIIIPKGVIVPHRSRTRVLVSGRFCLRALQFNFDGGPLGERALPNFQLARFADVPHLYCPFKEKCAIMSVFLTGILTGAFMS